MKNILFLLLLFSLSCRQTMEKKELESVGNELQNRKIKRITEAQLSTFAYEKGQQLTQILDQSTQKQFEQQTDFLCQNIAFEGLAQRYEFLISYRLICDSVKMDEKETQIWQAYQQNLANKQDLSENLQKISPEAYLFTRPFFFKKQFRGMWSVVLSKKELVKLYQN